MKITDVKIRKVLEEGKMKAIVSVTFDDIIAVHDIKVIDTGAKVFVAMPSRKLEDGTFLDNVHPINQETRSYIEKAVLNEYYGVLQKVGGE